MTWDQTWSCLAGLLLRRLCVWLWQARPDFLFVEGWAGRIPLFTGGSGESFSTSEKKRNNGVVRCNEKGIGFGQKADPAKLAGFLLRSKLYVLISWQVAYSTFPPRWGKDAAFVLATLKNPWVYTLNQLDQHLSCSQYRTIVHCFVWQSRHNASKAVCFGGNAN